MLVYSCQLFSDAEPELQHSEVQCGKAQRRHHSRISSHLALALRPALRPHRTAAHGLQAQSPYCRDALPPPTLGLPSLTAALRCGLTEGWPLPIWGQIRAPLLESGAHERRRRHCENAAAAQPTRATDSAVRLRVTPRSRAHFQPSRRLRVRDTALRRPLRNSSEHHPTHRRPSQRFMFGIAASKAALLLWYWFWLSVGELLAWRHWFAVQLCGNCCDRSGFPMFPLRLRSVLSADRQNGDAEQSQRSEIHDSGLRAGAQCL